MLHLQACPHRPPCPGCPRFGLGGIAPSARTRLAELAVRHGVPEPDMVEGVPAGYRVRARLAVRGRAASPKVGLFQLGTHRVVDIPRCSIHHPLVNQVAAALKIAIRRSGTPPYHDAAHRGLVRYAQVVVERATQSAQVVVVGNGMTAEPLLPLCDALSEQLGSSLHSLWFNGQPERTNTILGSQWVQLSGPEATRERLGGADVFFPPGAFGQSNLSLFETIVDEVHGLVRGRGPVVEFYAGVGALGLGLAAAGAEVTFNELSPASLRGLELGRAALGSAARARTRVVPGSAGEQASLVDHADIVIVDPPRKGLDPGLVRRLVAQPPRGLVYLSCGLESLVRDAEALAHALPLRRMRAYALFPFSEHVETLAVFGRGTTSLNARK